MASLAVRLGQWLQLAATEISNRLYALNTILLNPDGDVIDVQHPVPVIGDSVYCTDIWVEYSELNGFSGEICDLFNDLHTTLTDDSATNPKEIFIHFNRTVPTTVMGMGSFIGNFSNVKISALVSGPVEVTLIDESADSTKYTSRQFDLPSVGFNALRIQFHTADYVSLSNLFIAKARSVVSRIQGQKPDGDFEEFQATQAGNFKTSLEELENTISVNSNTQLRTTVYDEVGTPAKVDPLSQTLQIIDHAHHEIHHGEHFFLVDWVELDATETTEITFLTPSTGKEIHILTALHVTGQVEIETYEGTTATNDGTLRTIYNSNRNSSNTSDTVIRQDPTIIADGALLFRMSLGSGTNPANTVGAGTGRDDELIMMQNTKYLMRITSNTASNRISFRWFWYEHIDLT